LSARDSAAIREQYHAQLESRRGSYVVPDWLRDVQVARLQAAATRDVAGLDALPKMSSDSVRALLASGEAGTYVRAMLAEDDHIVTRWHQSNEPIRVWVQPQSSEAGFTADLVAPTRRAFSAWNEVGLGVAFEMVDDSTAADVHVTWRQQMNEARQIGTTFRMTGGRGWIAFAHVVLSTAYDIYAVQNAARHEAGHVLGLGHSPDVQDIMAAATEGKQYMITDADKNTARLLYSLPPGKVE
jgi:predicted Zn-dependent protease